MRTRSAAAVVLVALVGLVVSLVVVWSRLAPGTPVQESEPGPPAAVASASPESRSGPAEIGRSEAALEPSETSDAARPVRVALASVGIEAPVRPVGVAEDGQMRLPPDPRVMGWYRFGPAPGADGGGSVVIAGHLDSKRFGLGPLARLRDIEVGQPIEVTLADGGASTYTVVGVERFDRQGLPEELFSRQGPERLRVITCGGEYDPDAGGYQQNLVVTAAPA
ncbi:MAG TPA: class F sortase [Nocardioidaceae bacterium]